MYTLTTIRSRNMKPDASTQIYRVHAEEVENLKLKFSECKLVVMGDYNLPSVCWKNDELSLYM